MKRSFLLLLLLFLALYGKLGYELFADYSVSESYTHGSLSDIAEEVTAIPLKTSGEHRIEGARSVQKEGDNLFLISNNILYRFDKSGELICRISDPADITVAGYLIDPVKRNLIVMGNENDIYFYSFNGELLYNKKMRDDDGQRRIHTASLFQNRIWTAEECIRIDPDTHVCYVEKQLVEYDSSFQKISSRKLISADLYSNQKALSSCSFELGVSGDTGSIYAYSPTRQPEYLLRDTLLIKHRQQVFNNVSFADNATVYPLRFGSRYWISSYRDPADPAQNYTFCYDHNTDQSWYLTDGFNDNIYHTGQVAELKPLDPYSDTYFFCKSGKELKDGHLKVDQPDNTVLFIVRLKA